MNTTSTPIVRQLAFYWRDKKVVVAQTVRIWFTLGREPLYGQDGLLAWNEGVDGAVMRITASDFASVVGSFTTDDVERILTRERLRVGFVLGGKFFLLAAVVHDLKYGGPYNVVTKVELACAVPSASKTTALSPNQRAVGTWSPTLRIPTRELNAISDLYKRRVAALNNIANPTELRETIAELVALLVRTADSLTTIADAFEEGGDAQQMAFASRLAGSWYERAASALSPLVDNRRPLIHDPEEATRHLQSASLAYRRGRSRGKARRADDLAVAVRNEPLTSVVSFALSLGADLAVSAES